MLQIITSPVPTFPDIGGKLLEDGKVYFGQVNQNPETNPIAVYWDALMTQPAAQPIRTSGGLLYRNGAPANLYAASSYSMTVRNKNGLLMYTFPDSGLYNVLAPLQNATDPTQGDAMVAVKRTYAGSIATTVHNWIEGTFINVKTDFGAVGDGVTDDTAVLQAAIDALPGGGIIFVPRGYYRCTASLNLHSGLTFIGESCVNRIFGVPTGNERASHIFIDSDAGILFRHALNVQMESVSFTDISFASRLAPTVTPRGTSTGFHFSGSAPNDIKHLTFTRCQFANFGGYAIRVYDPLAGVAANDWNCCPVTLTDCTFYYNTIGVEFETDNADYWQFHGCAWFQGVGSYGINCKRSGVLVLDQCFGGGGTMLITSGTTRDSITFIGCQYEAATAMLIVADTMATLNTYKPIKFIDCVVESPVVLSAPCHFISEGSRWVNNLENTVANVLVDFLFDSFLSTTAVNMNAGSSVRNFLTHGADYPIGIRGPIIDGKCIRTAATPPVGGTVTFYKGDITYNSNPSIGVEFGWMCTTTGAPGVWTAMGQVGFRSQAGSPVNTVTPLFTGEEFLDTTGGRWYKSRDTSGANWVALN